MPAELINGFFISNRVKNNYFIVEDKTLKGFPWIYLDNPDESLPYTGVKIAVLANQF